jgi:hypothetical protein
MRKRFYRIWGYSGILYLSKPLHDWILQCLPSLLCLSLMTDGKMHTSSWHMHWILTVHKVCAMIKCINAGNLRHWMSLTFNVASCWKHPASFKNPHARPRYQTFRVSSSEICQEHEFIKSSLSCESDMQSLWILILFKKIILRIELRSS